MLSRSWWKQMEKVGARYSTDRKGASWLLSPYFYLRCPDGPPATISREPWGHTIDWHRRSVERGERHPTSPVTVSGHLYWSTKPERVLLRHDCGDLRRLYSFGDEAVLVTDAYAGLIDSAFPDAATVLRVNASRQSIPLCWMTGRRVEAVLLPIHLERNLVVSLSERKKEKVA